MPISKPGRPGKVISMSARLMKFASAEAVSAILRIPSHHAAGAAYTLLPNSRIRVERVLKNDRSPSTALWIRGAFPAARIHSSTRIFDTEHGLVETITFDVPLEEEK
jgi:hypothetical protein